MRSVTSSFSMTLSILARVPRALAGLSTLSYGLLVHLPAVSGDEVAEFFESKVRPVLVERCIKCHGTDTQQNGGLVLDSRAGWTVGGDRGTAIRPGDPDSSLLIQAVRYQDAALQMPPSDEGGQLTAAQIQDLETWVRQGAFDPRIAAETSPVARDWHDTFTERLKWWSLQPVRKSAPPQVVDAEWSATDVDRFLFARMSAEGLQPAAIARPETLIRRATLVLTGLPPTVTEVDEFLAAAQLDRATAYRNLVDRLLDSPHFGERFARHWLDVVRFTETHGNEWNYDVPYAWRYRDYLIRAFNQDLPYDQLVREHIAGDLLPHPRWNVDDRINESLIGTAFYRFGEVSHDSCVEFGIIGYDIIDNQLDTLTKTFQATTVACARCHDHKMDAVSTRDYHSLLGVLRSTRAVQHNLDDPAVHRDVVTELLALKAEIRRELCAAWQAEAKSLAAAQINTALADAATPPTLDDPMYAWQQLSPVAADPASIAASWETLVRAFNQESTARRDFNAARFTTVADLRAGLAKGWTAHGLGLQDAHAGAWGGDFAVAPTGEAAVQILLPDGIYSFAISQKLNGVLRSPTLTRTHGNLSFEVIGGRSSLARIVFNNCQLNYHFQNSLHHPDWSWVTIKFPPNTDSLQPYAELATFWDNPKFPDPLGTLGKDVENQRQPWSEHVQDARTWWGVRRIVAHDGDEPPRRELSHFAPLYTATGIDSITGLLLRYQQITVRALDALAAEQATDDQVQWLSSLLARGLLTNRLDLTPRLATLIEQYRTLEQHKLAAPTMVAGMADEGQAVVQPLLLRGDPARLGEPVPRGYLQAIVGEPPSSAVSGSGRRLVADAIAHGDNPLTARVMVNRVWQWVYGSGLVRTVDDFGHLGEPPSHPELLDHLAAQFVEEGWSVKRLVRELVLSRAFQSSAVPSVAARERDPRNVLLSHYAARRAEAEVVRDSILAVSGRLDPLLFGPSVHPYRETADPDKRLYTGPLDGDGRRSLYIKCQLMESPHFLRAFNLPGGKVTQGRRDSSNVPAQNLAMLNDPFVLAMADHWAQRLVTDDSQSVADRIDGMLRVALSRDATESERERLSRAVHQFARQHDVADEDVLRSLLVWRDVAHTVFNFKEFIFLP